MQHTIHRETRSLSLECTKGDPACVLTCAHAQCRTSYGTQRDPPHTKSTKNMQPSACREYIELEPCSQAPHVLPNPHPVTHKQPCHQPLTRAAHCGGHTFCTSTLTASATCRHCDRWRRIARTVASAATTHRPQYHYHYYQSLQYIKPTIITIQNPKFTR